jgi:hypothetical protein
MLPLTTVIGIYYCPGYLATTITSLRVYTREVPAASPIQPIHQFTVNAYALFEWLHIVLHQEDYNHGNDDDTWNSCLIPILISHPFPTNCPKLYHTKLPNCPPQHPTAESPNVNRNFKVKFTFFVPKNNPIGRNSNLEEPHRPSLTFWIAQGGWLR